MITLKKTIAIASLLFIIQACADILVDNISEEKPQIILPVANSILKSGDVLFKWEEVDGATNYQLLVVSPSFDSINVLYLDTIIIDNDFIIRLPDGQYEWQLTAINTEYSSQPVINRFSVNADSTINLSGKTINLSIPFDNTFTNENLVTFYWNNITTANYYIFELSNLVDFSSLITSKKITTPFYSVNFQADGLYFWRVRAVNESSLTMTQWASRKLNIDRLAPSTPALLLPMNNDSILIKSSSPDLSWSVDPTSSHDTVFIYNNAQKDILLLKIASTQNNINLDGTPLDGTTSWEDYFWEVKSVDLAGNTSGFSIIKKFWAK